MNEKCVKSETAEPDKTFSRETLAAEIIRLLERYDELDKHRNAILLDVRKEQAVIRKQILEKRQQYTAGAVQGLLPLTPGP